MEILKNNKGITLVALTITIILLLILASVTLYNGGDSIKVSKSNSLKAQLELVQHAILERYAEYNITKNENEFVGTEITRQEAQTVANRISVTLKGEGTYYRLTPEELGALGVQEKEDTYIVNYQTGEVLNETETKTPLGDVLYTSAN